MTPSADAAFWRGRRVLVTGHTGFKGSWLTLWLHRLGAVVSGVSLPPLTKPNLFVEADVASVCENHTCDIRDAAALAAVIRAARPEIVLHLAAQPLVRVSYREPRETFAANVMGTVNVLDALRGLDGVRVAVMATTDKVYRSQQPPRPHREDDAMGGSDPYSASKAACEMAIAAYREGFLVAQGVAVASARAGNVIGGGDWSEDRIIPDAVRAWQAGATLTVRRPHAIRPWQHVLEPLAGYLALAQALWRQPALAGAYNFGPREEDAVSVRDLIEMARAAHGQGAVQYCAGDEGPYESGWLALDIGKAKDILGVAPKLTLAAAIERTMAWYRAHRAGANALTLCRLDLAAYEALN